MNAGVICSGWSGVTLIMLSGAASALNLGIMRRCTRIVYIGEPAPAERIFGRYFAEDLSSVTDRIRFVGSDELSLCRRTGEWDTVWAHV